MTLVAVFLVNATLAFALSIVLAALLGPDAFGRYAIGLSITLVINTVLFEWLRLATTRFQSRKAQSDNPAIRRTIDLAYLATALVVGAGTAIVLVVEPVAGLSRVFLVAASLCGLAYGLCEYRMALARAFFLERTYVGIASSRALFGFLLSAGAAYATGDPAAALYGTALSALLPILLVHGGIAAPRGDGRGAFDPVLLRSFARYALPLIAANALYQVIPLLNRSLLASRDGFVEAGYFSLVSEIATRLFQNLGAALDIMLFQLAVRADEMHGREAAERQIRQNSAIVAAIVIPAAAGLWVVWPAFEGLFVPDAFRGHLDGTVPYIVPALALYALVQYALNPFFQLRFTTAPVVGAALVAVATNVFVVLVWPRFSGAEGFAKAQFAGLAAGLVTLLGLSLAYGARLPWRDLGKTVLAAAAMVLAILPLRGIGSPLLTLCAQVALGGLIYGSLALAFDLGGVRPFARQAVRRLTHRRQGTAPSS
jgi:O-antigen/teichoic acid export membrane protein